MKLLDYLEYLFTAGVLTLCRILPEAAVYALFRGFGILIYFISPRRRHLSLRNMEIAFPEKSAKERRKLIKKSYLNLADSMAMNTLITTGKISDEQMENFIEVEGWTQLSQLILTTEKGLLFFTGHLGNWELMSQYLGMRLKREKEKESYVIARKTNNQLLEDRIVRPLRERFGVHVLYKKNALMRSVKALNRGHSVGTLIDQRLNLQEGISVDFFGKEAGTSGMPALLQIRFGITAVPIFMVKIAPKKYKFLIGEPVPWDDNGKPMEEQVLELTRIHQSILEDKIKEYPDQWFWMHNRWGLPNR